MFDALEQELRLTTRQAIGMLELPVVASPMGEDFTQGGQQNRSERKFLSNFSCTWTDNVMCNRALGVQPQLLYFEYTLI